MKILCLNDMLKMSFTTVVTYWQLSVHNLKRAHTQPSFQLLYTSLKKKKDIRLFKCQGDFQGWI